MTNKRAAAGAIGALAVGILVATAAPVLGNGEETQEREMAIGMSEHMPGMTEHMAAMSDHMAGMSSMMDMMSGSMMGPGDPETPMGQGGQGMPMEAEDGGMPMALFGLGDHAAHHPTASPAAEE